MSKPKPKAVPVVDEIVTEAVSVTEAEEAPTFEQVFASLPVGSSVVKADNGLSVYVPQGNQKRHGFGATLAAAVKDAS